MTLALYDQPVRTTRKGWEGADIVLEGDLMITEGILPPLGSIQPPANEYKQRTSSKQNYPVRVPDWKGLDIPMQAEIRQADNLCICRHSRLQHSSMLGASTGTVDGTWEEAARAWVGNNGFINGQIHDEGSTTDMCSGTRPETGQPCKCRRFNPVPPRTSKHVWHRGDRMTKKFAAELRVGDWVLVTLSTSIGNVRLNDSKAGSLVAKVLTKPVPHLPDSIAGDQPWKQRSVEFETDLGKALPVPGGYVTQIVQRRD